MMKQQSRIVYGGVDTHLDVHVAAVIDDTGRLLGTKPFPTSPLGLRQLQRWLAGHGQVAKVGVEGTGAMIRTCGWRSAGWREVDVPPEQGSRSMQF